MYDDFDRENNVYYMDELEQQQQKQSGSKAKIGFAVTSLVLGVVSLLLCCCGLSVIAAPLSIIFGVIAIVKKHNAIGMAIAGISISVVMLIATALFIFAYGQYISDYFRFAYNSYDIIEEYQQSGELPDYLEKYNDEEYEYFWNSGGYDDFDDFLDDFIYSYDY